MIRNNDITEVQIVSVIGYLKQMHLTYDNVVADVIFFGAVYATAGIVWQDSVIVNF